MRAAERELLEAVMEIDWWEAPGGFQLLAELKDAVNSAPVEPDKLASVQAIITEFDARKPLPQMSQLATAALALHYCLDVIDAVREAVK